MGITEIVLLLLGAGAYVASFLIPEKKGKGREADRRLAEAQVKEQLEIQMETVRSRISDVLEERLAYETEKAERTMERISNEKIMAVNEYSDTVLDAIHKNHEEVMFLYDMLSDKQQSLKNLSMEAERRGREVLQQIRDAEADRQVMEEDGSEESKVGAFIPFRPEPAEGQAVVLPQEFPYASAAKEEDEPTSGIAPAFVSADDRPAGRVDVGLSFASVDEDGKNNNERILTLHRAGKSNVAIAKELGLGIGEVKLVIDLFKGV